VDFTFSEDEQAFRRELRAFLAEHLPAWWKGMFVDDPAAMAFTRDTCRELARRGWLTMAWPVEHGGSGASEWKQTVLREEMWAHDEPRGPQYMNLNYIGPLIIRFGTEEQRRRFLPPMARGEVIWCQGFSEPDAGSDLAALRTRAEERDGSFVVNGHKIWTSYADAPAQWCLTLVRTDPEASGSAGISVLLVDMASSGVSVRPIPTMAGPHELNEVFFDEVVVPADCLLGRRHQGWEIVRTGLAFERVGVARYARAAFVLDALVEHARRTTVCGRPLAEDRLVRAKLAELRVRCEAARLVSYQAISLQAAGQVPLAEAAVARMHNTLLEQAAGHLALELLGPSGQLTHDDPAAPMGGLAWRQWVRNVPTTVAAGTLETQKNIVARALGLPRSA
jgi:alkylation response protein AidB-like acyl-CoA dehydrogenase